MMKSFAVVVVAMLVWGNTAFADGSEEVQTIKSWMAHLNTNYEALNVRNKNDLKDQTVRSKTLRDLELLEGYLQGDFELNNSALKELLCGRPVCDGGDRFLIFRK